MDFFERCFLILLSCVVAMRVIWLCCGFVVDGVLCDVAGDE